MAESSPADSNRQPAGAGTLVRGDTPRGLASSPIWCPSDLYRRYRRQGRFLENDTVRSARHSGARWRSRGFQSGRVARSRCRR
jgi:hypothetical protein